MILLCVVPLILLRVVLQLYSILAVNHDFAAHSPINLASCSPPIIFTVRTTHSKMASRSPLHITTLGLNCVQNVKNNSEKDSRFQYQGLIESLKLPTWKTTLVPL